MVQRCHGWTLLKRLAGMSSLPWLVGGDFNEILRLYKKLGGKIHQDYQMKDFRRALKASELRDLGFAGPSFTWSNHQDGSQLIQEHLDRYVSNAAWRVLFLVFFIKYLDF